MATSPELGAPGPGVGGCRGRDHRPRLAIAKRRGPGLCGTASARAAPFPS